MRPLLNKFKRGIQKLRLFILVGQLNRKIAAEVNPDQSEKPVVFFNASARLEGLNQNGAFNLISSWGIQLAGRQVYHFSCRSGMSQCVMGAGLGDPMDPPPCQGCIQYTKLFTGAAKSFWFDYSEDPRLREIIKDKSISDLLKIEYKGRPLGDIVTASARWILRRHHLEEDQATRYILCEYILSANSIADAFSRFLNDVSPGVIVLFNGLMFPEAVVNWVAKTQEIRVITYEVNLQPFSAFFTPNQATSYPMDIPPDFRLSDQQNQILDLYLEKRFKGDFKMAGIKFWPSMDQLPDEFLEHAAQFDHLVPVFTNVIFDTSQTFANEIFSDMFAWLDQVIGTAGRHPDSLFVIRAHPDEMRKGKSSQENVLSWAAGIDLAGLPNVMVIGPDETLSSYELIQRSKFVMVYNSSIGLEASLLGRPVLCAGKARYTQYLTVYYPDSLKQYEDFLATFLSSLEIDLPAEYVENARKFLFYQLYRSSLPFGEFLTEHTTPGYVQLRNISVEYLKPGSSKVIDTVVKGILHGEEFILETDVL
jgi:hypothetical protein